MSVSLTAGSRLGHYRVGSRIGRGGMGEVYEAADLVLERRVALKILSQELFDRPDRIHRFIQEAKSASALNHPHILTVHEIGEEKVDGTPIHYIAMELVEGTTLREEIHTQHAPLNRLLDVLSQAADALAKAHATAIIHRDLKPDNIMVTTDGYAKVIDFGLAKLAEPVVAVSASDTGVETVTLTREGNLLGTVGYMSPEQVERKSTDECSDIFSFGCIVYEAITGKRAFLADSVVETLYKIVHDAPPPIPREAAIPDDLRRLVDRCLEKAPQDRYQSMRDVAIDLREIAQRLSAERRISGPSLRAVPWPGKVPSRFSLAFGGAGLLAVLVLAAIIVFRVPEAPKTPLMRALVRWPSMEWNSRFSPDGAWVSFLSDRDGKVAIWMGRVTGGEPSMIADKPAEITSQVWSPIGDQIAYLSLGTEKPFLQIIPAFGGPPSDSRELDAQFRDGDLDRWIGRHIYAETPGGLWRFDTETRLLSKVADVRGKEGRRSFFDVSADERKITYSVHWQDRETVWIANLDGSGAVSLTPIDKHFSDYRSRFVGASSDDLILSSDRSGQIDLWRISRRGNPPRQITFSPGVKWVEDVSADGRQLAMCEDRKYSNLWMWNGATGESRQLSADAVQDLWASASAAGSTVVFQRTKSTVEHVPLFLNSDLFVAPLSNESLSNIRQAVDDGGLPRLSPDGRWVSYVKSGRNRSYELWVKDLQSEHPWRVTDHFKLSGVYKFPVEAVETDVSWAPDSATLFFVERPEPDRQQIRVATPSALQSTVLISGARGQDFHDVRLSADGRLLAYLRRSAGWSTETNLIIRDLNSGRETTVFQRRHDWQERIFFPGWRANGDLVVLVSTVHPDWTEAVRAIEIDPSGRQTVISLLDRGFGGTARIDADSDAIVLTGLNADRIHNLVSVSLANGRKRPLTSNQGAGISFAGVETLPGNKVLFCRQESNRDLWLIDFPP